MSPERWLKQGLRSACASRWMSIGASLVWVLLIPLQAGLLALFFDALVHHADTATAYPWLALFGLVLLVRTVVRQADLLFTRRMSQQIIRQIDQQLFATLAKLPESVRNRKTHGEWVSLLHARIEALAGWYSGFYPQLWRVGFSCLVILLVVTWLNSFAGLLLLLTLPLLPLFMYLLGVHTQSVVAGQQQMLDYLSGFFADRLRHLPLLARFAVQDRTNEVLHQVNRAYQQRTNRVLRHALLSNAVLELFASMAIALLAVFIGLGLLGYIRYGGAAELTLFTGLFILFLVPEFFMPLKQLGQEYHRRAEALSAVVHIQTELPFIPIADSPPVADMPPGAAHHAGRIKDKTTAFEQTMASPDAPCLLQTSALEIAPEADFCIQAPALTLNAGGFVAVTGPSGAGKSLYLATLAGQEPVARGTIQRPDQTRVVMIAQRPWFLEGSVADNLRLTDANASEAQMQSALEAVGLDITLDFAIGYEGERLSGGMRQRLALAQAWLSGADVWLLDEITTGLDPANERLVLALLAQVCKQGVGVIVATHSARVMEQTQQHLQVNTRSFRAETDVR